MNEYDAPSDPRRPDWSGEVDADALQDTWALLGDVAGRERVEGDVDAAWARLDARLFGEESSGERDGAETAVISVRRRSPWRVAAAVAALALGTGAVWSSVPASATAGSGERISVVLPSGSTVDLNAGSTLRWARGFAWLPGIARAERVVHLEGEAYFDVESDGRPFRVEAGAVRIRVLGTQFNVRTRPGEGTDVSVTEGRVEVREGSDAVVLTAGEAVSSEAGALRRVDGGEGVPAWRSGGFSVTDARLSHVIDELERRFSVRIQADALAEADLERRVTLYYSSSVRVEGILDDVATALGLQYREVAGGWEVLPAP